MTKTSTRPRPAKRKGTHGGARPGAGRKPRVQQEDADGTIEQIPALGDAKGHSEITEMARRAATIAINSLAKVASKSSARDGDRIKAAEALLTWAYGKPLGIVSPPKDRPDEGEGGAGAATAPAAADPKLGKKAALEQAAQNPDPSTPMGRIFARRNLKAVS